MHYKPLAVAVIAGAVALAGVTLLTNRYFAAAFAVLVLLLAQRIGGEA